MKQNKNNCIKIAALFTAVIVLVTCISLPAFADSVNGVDFSNQPLPVSSDYNYSGKLNIGQLNNISYGAWTSTNASYPSYIFCFYDESNNLKLGACSTLQTAQIYFYGNGDRSGFACNSATDYEDIFFGSFYGTYSSYSNLTIPLFSTKQAAIDAIYNEINPTPAVPAYHLDMWLPAGNAIIINITGNTGERLWMQTTSALAQSDYWATNQTYGYFASAPSSISVPMPGTGAIPWRGGGTPTLFNQYHAFQFGNTPLSSDSNYLVVVNPAYPKDVPDNQATNGRINIVTDYCVSYQIVPLSSSWSNGSIVSESGNKRIDGTYDPDTGTWINTNPITGEPENPVAGGLTNVDTEPITINDWLQNIANQIGSFFQGAIGAVSSLVSAGADFMRTLSGLYSWLPAPVYSVLTSAIILVITIGVIKVFI